MQGGQIRGDGLRSFACPSTLCPTDCISFTQRAHLPHSQRPHQTDNHQIIRSHHRCCYYVLFLQSSGCNKKVRRLQCRVLLERYCSQSCQSDDWPAHSLVCRSMTEVASDEGFVMRPRPGKCLATMSKAVNTTNWDDLLPPNLKIEKGLFEIKVQTAGPMQAMTVYTKRKEICFTVVMNEGDNLPALHATIVAYPA
jgi:hypothetical protein